MLAAGDACWRDLGCSRGQPGLPTAWQLTPKNDHPRDSQVEALPRFLINLASDVHGLTSAALYWMETIMEAGRDSGTSVAGRVQKNPRTCS